MGRRLGDSASAGAELRLDPAETLPQDREAATLAGRVWRPDREGPSVVTLRGGTLLDVSARFPTMRDLCEDADPARALGEADGEPIGSFAEALANTPSGSRDPAHPHLLAPVDLQAVKAAGVTFATSLLERVIEERAKGDPTRALALRQEISGVLGYDLRHLKPGSPEAMRLKEALIAQGAWSQYLEVGIGPDAEVFTKAQPMSAVGTGSDIGVRPDSEWNNPEPEVVLAVSSRGVIVGASLGNDVNLRDFEGRSALLLPEAKDNNASCAIGPFLRFFDKNFTLDDVRTAHLDLVVEGADGYRLEGFSSMAEITRDPADLVAHAIGRHHAYPDGLVLFLGTLFAPSEDRDAPGRGFTHKRGDIVLIRSPRLGTLKNRVMATDECPPWDFGASHLMRNLARRGLL